MTMNDQSRGSTVAGVAADAIGALQRFLAQAPAGAGLAYVVALQRAPGDSGPVAALLQPHTTMKVQELDRARPVRANRVYLLPSDRTLELIDTHLRPGRATADDGSDPLDRLYDSLARIQGPGAVVVALDGAQRRPGLAAIAGRGGVALALTGDAVAASLAELARDRGKPLATNGLKDLLAGTGTAALGVDRYLNIRWMTPIAAEWFGFRDADLPQPLSALTRRLADHGLAGDVERILHDGSTLARELFGPRESWYLVQAGPLRSPAGIEGVALTFLDVTRRKREAQLSDAYLEAVGKERAEIMGRQRFDVFPDHPTDLRGEGVHDLAASLERRVAARTEQVRRLASSLAMAEHDERARVGRVLHDSLQQLLYGIQLKMALLAEEAAAKGQDQLKGYADEARHWIGVAIDTTRQITVDLNPPLLGEDKLADGLEWLQTQMLELHQLKVELAVGSHIRLPDPGLRVLLFQTVRELLLNVARHAGTKRAVITAREVGGDHGRLLAIEVRDDGGGFDPAVLDREDEPRGGFGLRRLRDRLDLFGGRLDVDAQPGVGSRLTVYLPRSAVSLSQPTGERST